MNKQIHLTPIPPAEGYFKVITSNQYFYVYAITNPCPDLSGTRLHLRNEALPRVLLKNRMTIAAALKLYFCLFRTSSQQYVNGLSRHLFIYRQISNVKRTKYQALNVSCLLLQLPKAVALYPIKWSKGAPSTSEWSGSLLSAKVPRISEGWW